MRFSYLILATVLAAAAAPAAAEELSGPAGVIDGDTIYIGNIVIDIHGIDAPELQQVCLRAGERWPCGRIATGTLAGLVKNATVACMDLSISQGRMRSEARVGKCRANGLDLGAAMVDAGMALAQRRVSRDYVYNEREARARGAGIFGGTFTAPWDWRRRQ